MAQADITHCPLTLQLHHPAPSATIFSNKFYRVMRSFTPVRTAVNIRKFPRLQDESAWEEGMMGGLSEVFQAISTSNSVDNEDMYRLFPNSPNHPCCSVQTLLIWRTDEAPSSLEQAPVQCHRPFFELVVDRNGAVFETRTIRAVSRVCAIITQNTSPQWRRITLDRGINFFSPNRRSSPFNL